MDYQQPPAVVEYSKDMKRQNLANEIFEFVRKHGLRMEDDPTQFVYDGCYDMLRTANELQHDVPHEKIHYPDSQWNRGGYVPVDNPILHMQHDIILLRIKWIIEGI